VGPLVTLGWMIIESHFSLSQCSAIEFFAEKMGDKWR